MESNPAPGRDVARLHAEWEEIHSQLRMMEQSLSDAIGLYIRGQGGKPQQVMGEVERLRALCDRRFRDLMQGIRAP